MKLYIFFNLIKIEKRSNDFLSITITFAFTLLQDCTTIERFNQNLLDIYNLFNNPSFDESVEKSKKVKN